jgi:hypothetical protein
MGRPGVTTANDLRGKIIGVSHSGHPVTLPLGPVLSMGIDLKKDVTLVSWELILFDTMQALGRLAIIAPLPRNIMMKKEGFTEPAMQVGFHVSRWWCDFDNRQDHKKPHKRGRY